MRGLPPPTTIRRLARRLALANAAAVMLLAGLAAPAPASAHPEPGEPTRPEPPATTVVAGFVRDARGRYHTVVPPRAATTTYAFGIDDRGRIVGAYDDADGRVHGFLREADGDYRRIDVPGAYATVATRINERGQIVGDYFSTRERYEQGLKLGFVLDHGRFTRFGVPGADSTEAVGLDDRGRIVGETLTIEPFRGRGYIRERGRIRLLAPPPGAAIAGAEEINERGQIVGTYGTDVDSAETRGYVLTRGRYTTFAVPGGEATQAFGLNNRGQVVGYTADVDDPVQVLLSNQHGFLLPAGPRGPVTRIDVPDAPQTIALGINDRGDIVGAYELPPPADGARAARAAGEQGPVMADVVLAPAGRRSAGDR
jgi:uncharacterized membrane protein